MIRKKYKEKKKNSKKRNIQFLLSREEFIQKIFEAGIKPNQISTGINDYHLARRANIDGVKICDGDLSYSSNTCEFILHSENIKERDESFHQTKEWKEKQRIAQAGRKLSDETKSKISKSAKGNKSNIGKIWIHNTITSQSKLIPKDQPIPPGFIKGRGNKSA